MVAAMASNAASVIAIREAPAADHGAIDALAERTDRFEAMMEQEHGPEG
jgi:hypothetical protein